MNSKEKAFIFLTLSLLAMSFYFDSFLSFAYRASLPSSGLFHPLNPLRERKCDSYGCGNFGSSRDGGKRRHMGQDFIGFAGQPVFSAESGKVAYIGTAYASGRYPFLKMVKIVSGNMAVNYMYVSPTVTVGQQVERGQQIGTLASLQIIYPGIPDHLHLEISVFGQKVDPSNFFKKIIV